MATIDTLIQEDFEAYNEKIKLSELEKPSLEYTKHD